MAEPRDEYYQRVRPVVGRALAGRRVGVDSPGETALVAEALIRTGLLDVQVAAGPVEPGSPAAAAFAGLGGCDGAAGLLALAREHNRFEASFAIAAADRPAAAGVDLVLGASLDGLRGAIGARRPAVILRRFGAERAFHGAVLVFIPGVSDESEVLALAEAVGLGEPPPALASFDDYLEWLELSDMALALAKWLLLRGHAEVPARDDLEARLGRPGGAVAVLRGRADWPFWVRFIAGGEAERLGRKLEERAARYQPPLPAPDARLLVLGCGTASLMLADAPWLFAGIAMADCKPFSVANPVRQLAGTEAIGVPKPQALRRLLHHRLALAFAGPGALLRQPGPSRAELADPTPPPGFRAADTANLSIWTSGERPWQAGAVTLGATELFLRAADEASITRFEALLDELRPTVTVVAMGRSRDDNFIACEVLRRRGLVHLVPTALPGVSHYKHILVDGKEGPCYDCLQGHLAIDGGQGPTLTPAERELYYGGTQPATLAETYPSAHSLLRLVRELALPRPLRSAWLLGQLGRERNCFVGANRVEPAGSGIGRGWLYGTAEPFQMVTYGIEDIVGSRAGEVCSCGRVNALPRPAGGDR